MADKTDDKTNDKSTTTADTTTNTASESPAKDRLEELRNSEPVGPTPTTEANKKPEDNELSDNERKAENELAELERTNALHITDDYHKEAALKETIAYEQGQKEQRSEIEHANEVTNRQHEKFTPEAK